MTRSAINQLRGFFWVAKRMAKRLTSNLRDATLYEGMKSSQTKYPVEGESVNTKSELDTFRKKYDFRISRLSALNLQFVLYFKQNIFTKQRTFYCCLEKTTETKKKKNKQNKTKQYCHRARMTVLIREPVCALESKPRTFKHEPFNVCLLNYLLPFLHLDFLFIHLFILDFPLPLFCIAAVPILTKEVRVTKTTVLTQTRRKMSALQNS